MTDPHEPDDSTHAYELNLEPVQFIARTDAVMRFGAMMLGAGASSARVREGMERAASAVGIDELHTRVGMTDVVATARRGGLFRTRLAEIGRPSVNATRITELLRVSNELTPGMTAAGLQTRLDRVEALPRRYAGTVRVIGVAAACAAFALLNNGGWQECLAVAIAAGLGQWVRMLLHRIHMNEFLMVFVSAVTALLAYLLISGIFPLVGLPGAQHDAALTSAVLYLVPGFPLVTGALDLGRLDLNAGLARVAYACLVLLAAGTAVWGVAAVFDTTVTQTAPPAIDEPLLSMLRFVAGFVGVLGFAVLFSTPWRAALAAGVIGGVANVGRLLIIDGGGEPAVAAAAAALAVGIGAFFVGNKLRVARVTLTVPAVIIMVPGSVSYRAIAGMIDGDTLAAIENGLQALFIVVALAIGLTLTRVMLEREWTVPTP